MSSPINQFSDVAVWQCLKFRAGEGPYDLVLKTESQSTGSEMAASFFGMAGKKDCIFCLNSTNCGKEE